MPVALSHFNQVLKWCASPCLCISLLILIGLINEAVWCTSCNICNMTIQYINKQRSYKKTGGYAYRCNECGHTFTLFRGTIFYETRLSLEDIIKIIWWYTNMDHEVYIFNICYYHTNTHSLFLTKTHTLFFGIRPPNYH